MKKKIVLLLIGIIFLYHYGLPEDFKVSVLPVDQIEKGMKGIGFQREPFTQELDIDDILPTRALQAFIDRGPPL